MATRPDVIGVEAANDLSRLKDQIPPFPKSQALKSLRAEFGAETDSLFPDLGNPIAAASVAQVHRIETPKGPAGGENPAPQYRAHDGARTPRR